MDSLYSTFLILLALAAVIGAILALFAWRRRSVRGSIPFIMLTFSTSVWSLGYLFELMSNHLPTKLLFAKVEYLGIEAIPVMWLIFTMEITGKVEQLTARSRAVLLAGPLVAILLVWSNEYHGLIWQAVELQFKEHFSVLDLTYGIGFWAQSILAYSYLIVGTILLVRAFTKAEALFRSQVRTLLISLFAPWIANALYITGLNPLPGFDLTPLAFTFSGMVMAWGLYRYQLMDIVPIARGIVLEHMRDGVVTLDVFGRVVDLNQSASAILGCERAAVIGKNLSEVFGGWPALVYCLQELSDVREDFLLTQGYMDRHFDIHVVPLRSGRASSFGHLIVLHDITERKRVEQDIQQAHAQLEKRVKERTIELREANRELKNEISERKRTENELQGYAAKLEQSNTELKRFAQIASHDLKEPLRMVSTYTQLLADRYEHALDDDALEFISYAVDGAKRMHGLINDLLAYSRLETDPKKREAVDLTLAVEDAVGNLKSIVEESAAQISMNGMPTVCADSGQMVQLFQNLIENAIKFHGEQPPRIEICGQRVDGSWQISVEDNGIGIAPKHHVKVFDIFQRLHREQAYPGTGVGLAVCKRIVEGHGGRIWIESEPGMGSRFLFTIVD